MTRRAGVHAASGEAVIAGLATPAGHSAPSGQFSENQRMARSKLPVVRSPPDEMRAKVLPSPKMRVEIPDREGRPSRPLVPMASA